MIPNVVKFLSIDGLSRFEAWNNPNQRPPDEMRRIGTAWTGCSDFNNVDTLPTSSRMYTRYYRLYDHYVDDQNGNRVFVYKEHP